MLPGTTLSFVRIAAPHKRRPATEVDVIPPIHAFAGASAIKERQVGPHLIADAIREAAHHHAELIVKLDGEPRLRLSAQDAIRAADTNAVEAGSRIRDRLMENWLHLMDTRSKKSEAIRPAGATRLHRKVRR